MSRLDGQTSLREVILVTGLPEGRVRQIVDKLVQHGAVDGAAGRAGAGDDGDGGSANKLASGPNRRPPAVSAAARQAELTAARALLDELSADSNDDGLDDPTIDDQPAVTEDAEPPFEPQLAAPEPVFPVDAPSDQNAEIAPADAEDGETSEATEGADENPDELGEAQEGNYRKLYETELHKLELSEREAMAKNATDPHLSALCFDAHPTVIKLLFENSAAGFQQARLVARHHRTPQGLDVVLNRAEFFRDSQTQRLMLANPMLQDVQIRKVLGSRRLAEVYKAGLSRDIPERNRQKARLVLRNKWATAEGEERAGLIFTTEGRCLIQLAGLPFDSQTSAMLCAKTYASTLLIQNLARFAATPPNVLQHLARQAVVKRQAHLRQLILQHPNCPSDVKRKT
jgi:hypothetical protein